MASAAAVASSSRSIGNFQACQVNDHSLEIQCLQSSLGNLWLIGVVYQPVLRMLRWITVGNAVVIAHPNEDGTSDFEAISFNSSIAALTALCSKL